MTREHRQFITTEFRFADDGSGKFSGYAATWDKLVPGFNERVRRGAFSKSLAAHKTRGSRPAMFFAHDSRSIPGVWETLTEDAHGLRAEGRLLLDTAIGKEAHTLMKAEAMRGLSIGFNVRQSERGPNGERILTELDLVEVSLTAIPAAEDALVTSVRSDPDGLDKFISAVREAASTLRG